MTFPILPSNGPSGYNLTRSLRFRSSASAYLNRTPASTTNRQKWTWSGWVKRGALGSNDVFFVASDFISTGSGIRFNSSNQLELFLVYTGTVYWNLITTQVFRDPSAWYHIVVALDTTQATASNRLKFYVNGTQVTSFATSTYPPLNDTGFINNSTYPHYISRDNTSYFDGYLAEVNFVDGQALTPSSFGSTNTLTGVWQPAPYTGSYGTNGFILDFEDNSALTTSSNVGLGKDTSGNGNYWTTNNISITAGVTYDSMTDVPTLTSATAANFCTWNPLLNSSYTTLSNGNLTSVGNTSTDNGLNVGTIGVSSGKWYWEATIQGLNGTSVYPRPGFICNIPANGNAVQAGVTATLGLRYNPDGEIFKNTNVSVGVFASFTTNDVISFALDVDSLTCGVYKNNTLQTTVTGLTLNKQFFPANVPYDGGNLSANFGQRPFVYTPPTGYLAINTYNLPTSTIVKGNAVMDATLYSGDNAATQTIVNAAGFKPDAVWLKSRSTVDGWAQVDSVRGVNKLLQSNNTNAESTTGSVTAFNSNGFSADINFNVSGRTYVGYQWQAGQGTTSSNTSGTITSTVSVNASAGFSVVTYTAQASGTGTVGHGLGVAPSLIITKPRANPYGWTSYHASLGNTQYVELNTTGAAATNSTVWNNTSPTSSVFTLGSAYAGNGTYVAYCWTPIAGYSAFGSLIGNGSTDGPFVYTGFKPRFILYKRTDSTGDWRIWDTARTPYNTMSSILYPNASDAEFTGSSQDFDALSNGFKIRNSSAAMNASGGTYIYAAFSSNPFKNSLAQ